MTIYHIYCITNMVNGKKYIGKTSYKNPAFRWTCHKSESRANRSNSIFHKAIRKYGENNFLFEIIDKTFDIDYIDILEKLYIKKFKTMTTGYNMTDGGERFTGYKWSEEQKAKISGKNNIIHRKDVREKVSKTWFKPTHKYILHFNDGQIKEIINLHQWCKDNGYTRSVINKVVNGKSSYHKDIVKAIKLPLA